MDFKDVQLKDILELMDQLEHSSQPNWGSMSAQRMVEHLTDTLDLSMGNIKDIHQEISPEKVERAKGFLLSEHPMPKNFEASFAPSDARTRNESLELALDEFALKWIEFEYFFNENPQTKTLHPNFGKLDKILWQKLNAKHIKHHFEQFELVQ